MPRFPHAVAIPPLPPLPPPLPQVAALPYSHGIIHGLRVPEILLSPQSHVLPEIPRVRQMRHVPDMREPT